MRVHIHFPPAWHHEPSSQPLLCAQHLATFSGELLFGPGDFLSQLALFGVIAGTVGVTAGIDGRHPVKPQAVFGNFLSELVTLGETAGTLEGNTGTLGETAGTLEGNAGTLGETAGTLEGNAGTLGGTAGTLGEIFGFLGETAGILGRHLVKPQAVPGDLELLLQHPEPSYPELAANKLLEEFVDWPQVRELHDACWPPSSLFSCLTPADCCQLHPPEPTLEWEDHPQMNRSQLTLRGDEEWKREEQN